MNIAIFASAFHPHVGGVEELCRQLAGELMRRGHGVIVLTNRWPRDLPREELYEGIQVYRLAMRVPEGGARVRMNYWLSHGLVRREMMRILRRHQVDVLHVQCVSCNGYYAWLARRELGLPLVVTAQGERTMDAGRIYERSAFQNEVLRTLLAEADHITACSRHTLADLEGYFGKSLQRRSSVIYNGIRVADFAAGGVFEHRRPYVLGIGRHVPQKGFDVLLRAFARVVTRTHDLVLAGDGPEHENLRALARDLKVDSRVRFVGRADRALAVALFQGCDFFVLPSRMEPQGIVNLEAMTAGKAVVASATGGVPEIVRDGETGLLVKPEDEGALARAMGRLMESEEDRRRLGEAGRRRAEEFDWAVITQRYEAVYESVEKNLKQKPETGGAEIAQTEMMAR